MLTGLLLAVFASLLFNAAIVIQSVEARRVPTEHGLRLSLLGRLARRPRWLGGVALSLVAVAAQTLALTLAPLTVVQPADAAGLLLLLVIGSRVLGEQVGRPELAAVAGIVVGIVTIAAAGPARSVAHPSAAGLVAALLVLGALAVAPYVLRGRRGTRSLVVVLGAGFAFATASFAIKLVADSLSSRAWVALAAAAAVAIMAGASGTISEQTALQRRQVTQVAPIIFVTELVVPLLLAVTVGSESWGTRPLALCAISTGLGLLVLSAVALTQTPAVSRLLAAEDRAPRADRQPSLRAPAPAVVRV